MPPIVRRVHSAELTPAQIEVLRELFAVAWPDGDFDENDWQHASGGIHVLVEDDGEIRSHAAVVERDIEAAGHLLDTGYVEAVATWPEHEGRGYGSAAMTEANAVIGERYELGALGTGRFTFYERLGWERWLGPTFVREVDGVRRTPDDDGAVFILRTPTTPPLDLGAELICDWRPGDVW
ncbi:MAG TPA: GNAT family N-acetyltransferase [Candidatus Limnocylindrales bacterium]